MKTKKKQKTVQKNSNKALVVLAISVFALIGLLLLVPSFAAPKNNTTTAPTINLYLNPSSGRLAVGQTVDVEIRVNTLTKVTNAVQADISYDAAYFDYVGVDDTGSAFSIIAQSTTTPGLIKIARGATTGVTGDQLVTKVRLTPKKTTRKTLLTFNNTSEIVEENGQANLIQKLIGANYSIR